jgi:hypothetical protein
VRQEKRAACDNAQWTVVLPRLRVWVAETVHGEEVEDIRDEHATAISHAAKTR